MLAPRIGAGFKEAKHERKSLLWNRFPWEIAQPRPDQIIGPPTSIIFPGALLR